MKKIFLFLSLLGLLSLLLKDLALAGEAPRFAVATTPAPVLNTPDFKKYFSGKVKLDPCKGVRPVEFVALPGTMFRIEGETKSDGVTIYRVSTNDYPYPSKTGYYADSRFLKEVTGAPKERPRSLPEISVVQQRLLAAVGEPYVWGGDVKDGVPLLRELYPGGDPLAGLDCSGLLYQATDGFTPRNTSALTSFGEAVPVAGLSPETIAGKLKPLDLIAWKGHVMIVLDGDSIIQSTMGCQSVGGVHITPLQETVRRLMARRKPVDDYPKRGAAKVFVVRRWAGR
jgi:cell wall-associated NlpC family hydrolase